MNEFSLHDEAYKSSLQRRTSDSYVLLDVLAELRGRRISNEDSVLDIGCGPSDASEALWDGEEDCPGTLVGIDKHTPKRSGFWGKQDRTFVQADIADWNGTTSFDLVWSSYSLQQIAAQFHEKDESGWEDRLWQRISALVKRGKYFACIGPAEDVFFPLLSDVARLALSRMGVDPDTYRKQRAKTYTTWPKLQSNPPEDCSLQKVACLRLYSWKGIDEKTAFRIWWSANHSSGFLKKIGLEDEPESSFTTAWRLAWSDYREKKGNSVFVHPSDPFKDLDGTDNGACALGETRSLLQVWQKTSETVPMEERAQRCRRPSVFSWRLPFVCQEEAISNSTAQSVKSSELVPDDPEVKARESETQFATKEPVIHRLLEEGSLSSSTIYAIRLHGAGRRGVDRQFHAYSNNTWHRGENAARNSLITRYREGEQRLARLNPITGDFLNKENKPVFAWAVHVHSVLEHRQSEYVRLFSVGAPKQDDCMVVLTVRHNVAKECYDYDDTRSRLRACWEQLLKKGLQVVLPDLGGEYRLSSLLWDPLGEEEIASTAGLFNYFAWQACIKHDHLFLLCNVSISDASEESQASLGVDFAFSTNFPRENLELGDLQLLATCLRSALTSGVRRIERDRGKRTEFMNWARVRGHEFTKLYSGLLRLTEPSFLWSQGIDDDQRHLINEFCRVVLNAEDLEAVTGKGVYAQLPLLGDEEGVDSAYAKLCRLAWQLHWLHPDRILIQTSSEEDWRRAITAFAQERPINIDTSECVLPAVNVDAKHQTREWLALIVLSVLRNALKHSVEFPNFITPSIRVSIESQGENNTFRCAVTNTHSDPDKRDRFLARLHESEPDRGTFFSLHQYGRELFSLLGGKSFTTASYVNGHADENTATLTITVPLGES
ncbi:MAG: hypothetical protein AB2809_15910 [Candidatus Thiodiazotropha sp.]